MQVGVRDGPRTWRPFVIAYYTGGENAQAGARKWVAWLAATVAIPRMLKSLARMQVLILDDWGITPLTAEQRRDLLEIVNDRHGRASGIEHFGASAPHKLRVNSRKYHKSRENSLGSGDLPDSDRPMTNLIRRLMTPA